MSARLAALFAAAMLGGCSQQASDPAAGQTEAAQSAATVRSLGNPFPNASEVRLFVESGEYDDDGHPTLSSSSGRTLTADQRKAFEETLRIEPVPEFVAACFIPHHFFRYFDANGSQVGEVAVCFCCSGVELDGDAAVSLRSGEMVGADYAALEQFVQSLGEPTDIACD